MKINIRKRLLSLIVLGTLVLTRDAYASEVFTSKNDRQIRKGPSTEYESIGTLPNGEKAYRIVDTEEWDIIDYNGIVGYAEGQKFRAKDNDNEKYPIINKMYKVNKLSKIYNFSNEYIEHIYKDSHVRLITQFNDEYSVINYGDKYGLIKTKDLDIVTKSEYQNILVNDELDKVKKQRNKRGFIYRLTIPEKDISVAVFDSFTAEACDRKDSAASKQYGSVRVIGDHNYEGFNRYKTSTINETLMYTNNGKTIKEYVCTDLFQGHNLLSCVSDLNYNNIMYDNKGGITLYTCNECWENVTIAYFQPTGNVYEKDDSIFMEPPINSKTLKLN